MTKEDLKPPEHLEVSYNRAGVCIDLVNDSYIDEDGEADDEEDDEKYASVESKETEQNGYSDIEMNEEKSEDERDNKRKQQNDESSDQFNINSIHQNSNSIENVEDKFDIEICSAVKSLGSIRALV